MYFFSVKLKNVLYPVLNEYAPIINYTKTKYLRKLFQNVLLFCYFKTYYYSFVGREVK